MTCVVTDDDITAFALGVLDDEHVKMHITECTECQAEVQRARADLESVIEAVNSVRPITDAGVLDSAKSLATALKASTREDDTLVEVGASRWQLPEAEIGRAESDYLQLAIRSILRMFADGNLVYRSRDQRVSMNVAKPSDRIRRLRSATRENGAASA